MRFFDFSDSTICAAYINSVLLLISAVLAYKGATRESKRQEQKNKSLQIIFRDTIRKLLEPIIKILAQYEKECKKSSYSPPESEDQINPVTHLTPFPITLPEELKPENWKNYAYLQPNEVELVIQLRDQLNEYNSFQEKIKERERGSSLPDELNKIQSEYKKHLEDLRNTTEQIIKSLSK